MKRRGSVKKESVLQQESVSKGRPSLATLPNAHATTETLQMLQAQPFPAPYEKSTTVPKVLKKKIPRLWPLLLDHNACCFHVQVDLISPLPVTVKL